MHTFRPQPLSCAYWTSHGRGIENTFVSFAFGNTMFGTKLLESFFDSAILIMVEYNQCIFAEMQILCFIKRYFYTFGHNPALMKACLYSVQILHRTNEWWTNYLVGVSDYGEFFCCLSAVLDQFLNLVLITYVCWPWILLLSFSKMRPRLVTVVIMVAIDRL